MGSTLIREEFAPMGANSFLSELTPNKKGGKIENGRIASLESVPLIIP